ncbi:transcriptional regulator swi6 [Chytriomyces hyalinus]|nr:transcriptional regulator swi6 [Chytriomyces hyalinus]
MGAGNSGAQDSPSPDLRSVQLQGNIPIPVIYGAVYSGIPVYEMMCNGTAIMKRRTDSYFNVTQILKVAGVEKSGRAKILGEMTSDTGTLEKVQGGFGRYQGTWMPMMRARDLAAEYGVLQLIQPLIDFVPPAPSTGGYSMNSPYTGQSQPLSSSAAAPPKSGTNFQPDPPAPQALRVPASIPLPSSNQNTFSNSFIQPAQMSSPFQTPANTSNQNRTTSNTNGAVSFAQPKPQPPLPPPLPAAPAKVSPAPRPVGRPKRVSKPSDAVESTDSEFDDLELAMSPPQGSTSTKSRTIKRMRVTENSDSESVEENTPQSIAAASNLAATTAAVKIPLQPTTRFTLDQQRSLLLSIFTSQDRTSIPEFLQNSANTTSLEPNLAIDDAGHTALHWSATLAKLSISRALISSEACSPMAKNHAGETPLMRAVLSTNCHDAQDFPSLLELCSNARGCTSAAVLLATDAKGRNVLHHVALGFGVKGHAAAARYYLESLLAAVKIGKTTGEMDPNGFLDARDGNGDTAMNIAARLGGRVAVEMLLEAGADTRVENLAGLKPSDFGMDDLWKGKLVRNALEVHERKVVEEAGTLVAAGDVAGASELMVKRANDLSKEIQKRISSLNASFNTEIRTKQIQLSEKQKELEALSTELSDLNRMNQSLRVQNSRLPDLKLKMRAIEESLEEQLEKDVQKSREALERDLENASGDVPNGSSSGVAAFDEGDFFACVESPPPTVLPEKAHPLGATSMQGITPTASVEVSPAVVRQRIAILSSHLSKQRADNITLRKEIETINEEDAQLELKYRQLIGNCCKLPLEMVDSSLIAMMLSAVESEDNGLDIGFGGEVGKPSILRDGNPATFRGGSISGEIRNGPGSNEAANGSSASNGKSVAGAGGNGQQDMIMDGLLYKAASLPAPKLER